MLITGDPLDNRYISLAPSAEFPLAGEGAHARVDVPPNTVFSVYSGFLWTAEVRKEEMERIQRELEERNITDNLHPEKIAAWKYRCDLLMYINGNFHVNPRNSWGNLYKQY